jgi:hypothetical protein
MREKDALHAGLTPGLTPGQHTVFSLCGRFLTTKKQLLKTGELAKRSFEDYTATCKLLIKRLGKHQPVAGITPAHFERLRTLSKEMRKLLDGLDINGHGNFSTLRQSFADFH